MGTGNFRSPGAAIVLLSGLPGTGKTTFARALGARLRGVHIESDAVRRELFETPRYTAGEHGRVFGEVERRVEAALAANQTVMLDATNLQRKDRRRYERLALLHGARLVAVRMVAPETTARERLRRPREGFSQADERVYDLMRDKPEPFRGPVVVVDSRYPLDAALTLVTRLLGQSGG